MLTQSIRIAPRATLAARRAPFPLVSAARPALRSPSAAHPPCAFALRRGLTNSSVEEIKKRNSAAKQEVRTPTLFRPLYTGKDVEAVKIAHFKPKTLSDKIAFGMIYMARYASLSWLCLAACASPCRANILCLFATAQQNVRHCHPLPPP